MAGTRGGARTGAGRPRGSVNRRCDEIEAKLTAMGCDPAEGLAKIASEAWSEGDKDLAARCFTALLPYLFPKLKISEISIAQVDMAETIIAARQRLQAARSGNLCAPIPAGPMATLDFMPVPEPVQAAAAPVAPAPAPPAPPPAPPRHEPGIPTWLPRPPQPTAPAFLTHSYNPFTQD
jgi:hypothetical protein